jgi:SAM-dependent methyltransferase
VAHRVLQHRPQMAIDRTVIGGGQNTNKRAPFLTPRALSTALRARKEITDEDFDRFVAARFQGACREATPLAVAIRAAQLLTDGSAMRVLDAGAGIGKFSIIGALTTAGLFTGIERQLSLVRAARGIALRLGARPITFVHGSVTDIDLRAFDAIYLFDPPFGQIGAPLHLAGETALDQAELSASCTSLTWRKLFDARKGTRIVTYFGDCSPPGYRVLQDEPAGTDRLVLFVKD